jgi:hypothetical protein
MASTVMCRIVVLLTVGLSVVCGEPAVGSSAHRTSLEVAAEQYVYGQASWTATLTADRRLTVKMSRDSRSFSVPESKMRELETLLARERFFGLADSYGETDIHEFRSIAATLNGRSKRVVIYAAVGRETRTDELKRALRVAIAMRSLFDWPDAFDSRQDDEALLAKLSAGK